MKFTLVTKKGHKQQVWTQLLNLNVNFILSVEGVKYPSRVWTSFRPKDHTTSRDVFISVSDILWCLFSLLGT